MQIARKKWAGSEKVLLESFGRRMRGQRGWGDQGLNCFKRHWLARIEKCTIIDNCNWKGQNPKKEDGRKRYLFRSLTRRYMLLYVSNLSAVLSQPGPMGAIS